MSLFTHDGTCKGCGRGKEALHHGCTEPDLKHDNADLKRWMLARVSEAEIAFFRRTDERERLPATFEMEAVAACWTRHLSAHFQGGYARKFWSRQRQAAQKAMTFAELDAAIEAIP